MNLYQLVFPFIWQATEGLRPYLLLLILFTAGAASFEALLFKDWTTRRLVK